MRGERRRGSRWWSPDDVPTWRLPTPEELKLVREVIDPDGVREREVPDPPQ
jgi:hypothetical protein